MTETITLDRPPVQRLAKPPTIDDKVLAAVDGEWRTAREIFEIVDEGAAGTIRGSLAALTNAGKVERRYYPHPSGEVARYRACRT